MADQSYEIEQTLQGLMECMVGAMLHPVGTFDERSVVEFIRCALALHAWCVREDMTDNIIASKQLDRNYFIHARETAIEERLDHSQRLSRYAMFMSAPKELIRNSTTTH